MCEACADGAEFVSLDAAAMWRLARDQERDMDGAVASERDWLIFQGRATGALGFRALSRMSESRLRAIALLKAAPSRSGFRCDPVA